MKQHWSTLAREAKQMIERHGLMQAGDLVLVGVSGGADSVALLAGLRELAPMLKVRLAVAHLNHGLRGADATLDAAFVQHLAETWALPCVVGRAHVRRRAKTRGVSLEMAAREARYAFLEQSARRLHADAIAVAHTIDDQAETVLLKLARGAGPDGLAGMRPRRILKSGIPLIRPLLETRRRTIETYLTGRRLAWREDASNALTTCLRNIVRHEVLPLLESTVNPTVRAALARTAAVCRTDADCLELQARDLLTSAQGEASTLSSQPGEAACKWGVALEPLLAAMPALRRRALRLWLIQSGVDGARLDFEAVCRIERLMRRRQGGGMVAIGGGWQVCRMAHQLALTRAGGSKSIGRPENGSVCPIPVPGTTVWAPHGWRVTVRRAKTVCRERGRIGQWPACATLNLDKLEGRSLSMRFWQPGDRMAPMGIKGSKKLQDIFMDAKVPKAWRTAIPILECEGDIVWLPGYRVAQGWGVNAQAKDSAWHIRIESLSVDDWTYK